MRKYLFLVSSFLSFPAVAQSSDDFEPPAADETGITVTATGLRSEIEDTGQAVVMNSSDKGKSPSLT